MTSVDLLRIGEVRRRLATVLDYLAKEMPNDASLTRHARSLGLSVNQFLALVRARRKHGRAVAISGAGAARGTARADIPRSLPGASKVAAREVIAAFGQKASHADVVRAVQARCAGLGVKAPSPSTVWNMMMSARRDAAQPAGGGIIVSRCNLKLPVVIDNEAPRHHPGDRRRRRDPRGLARRHGRSVVDHAGRTSPAPGRPRGRHRRRDRNRHRRS